MTGPERFKVIEPQCDPDLRCDGTVTTTHDDGLEIGLDCVLHFEHDGDHTDGDGTWWDDDGNLDFR